MQRRGIAALLGLALVVLLFGLSVALLAVTGTNLRQADGLAAGQAAQLQAESGLGYMIYQLNGVELDSNDDANAILSSVANYLGARLNGAAALGFGSVLYSPPGPNAPEGVRIPAVAYGDSGTFGVLLTAPAEKEVRLLVTGQSGIAARAISVVFDVESAPGGSFVLDYGIVSKGPIKATGNVTTASTGRATDASICSATYSQAQAIRITGNANIAGDLYISNPDGEAKITGNATIGGASGAEAAEHIHIGCGDPNIPEVDPNVFRYLATNVMDAGTPTTGNNTYDNLYIPAGMNPTFTGNVELRGVTFVEKPNRVMFTGNANVTGVLVTEDAGDNVTASNYIKFTGNSRFYDVAELPDLPQFTALRAMPGSCILAPGFGIHMAGNFGTIAGWIAADEFKFTGNVNGTIRGGIINYGDTELKLTGNASLTFDRDSDANSPPGFVPKPGKPVLKLQADSYTEVSPR